MKDTQDLSLEPNIDVFMKNLEKMLSEHEGEWTLIGGDLVPLGFYNSEKGAYKAGLIKYGNVPFLIRQVSQDYIKHGRNGKPEFIGSLATQPYHF